MFDEYIVYVVSTDQSQIPNFSFAYYFQYLHLIIWLKTEYRMFNHDETT